MDMTALVMGEMMHKHMYWKRESKRDTFALMPFN